MKATSTFRFGGIQLAKKKFPLEYPVPNAFLPTDAVIPLRQHAGAPAKRIVEAGETVREGQLIGKAAGAGSANVHSPIPGVVQAIRRIPDVSGGYVEAVTVALEGSFERLGRKTELFPWRGLSKHQILRAIADKGVVEDDGSGIPLYDRLNDPKGLRTSCVLVVNCIESDPWNHSASAILVERAAAIQEGIEILKRILSPSRTILATDAENMDAFCAVPAQEGDKPEILAFEPRYPQDLSSLLREAITRKKQKDEELLVVSLTTVASVYDAVALNRPQVERYVTVSGDAVKSPGVLRVRIGSSIGEILEECGGFGEAPEYILLNGPFRGTAASDLDLPILKTTRSVVALTSAEAHRRAMTACIRCGQCVMACPERIDPSRLYKRVVRGALEEAVGEGLARCTECGSCAYLCPSRLPLVQAFSLAKQKATAKGIDLSVEGRTA